MAVLIGLVLLVSIILLVPVEMASGDAEGPPVVLMILETTRADHIGPCYGYDRETAPSICGVAEDGVIFKKAYSQGSWTPISFPSLMTGAHPAAASSNNFTAAAHADLPWVTSELAESGYRVIGKEVPTWTESSENFLGLNRSFDSLQASGNVGDGEFLFWFFKERAHHPYLAERRFRLWGVQNDSIQHIFYETTEPQGRLYRPLKASESTEYNITQYLALYDAEIKSADASIGRKVREMKESGTYRDSLIIITSDHGEYFGELGRFFHGRKTPRDPVIRVPLVVKFPGNRFAGQEVSEPVSLTSVAPTIYRSVGIEPQDHIQAPSLDKVIESGGMDYIYSAAMLSKRHIVKKDNLTLLMRDPTRCDNRNGTGISLFNSSGEKDISRKFPAKTENLSSLLCGSYKSGISMRDEFYFNTPEGLETRLEELGYVEPAD